VEKLDALPPLLLDFALECNITKVLVNQKRLELNRTHQLLVYAGDFIYVGQKHKCHTEKYTNSVTG
jgi:hypothetical protein